MSDTQEQTTPQPALPNRRKNESMCHGLKVSSSCGTPIRNGGINGSGFCEKCWYPSIEEDYETFLGYRASGMGRNEAAIQAGLLSKNS